MSYRGLKKWRSRSCECCRVWKRTFIPAQAATTDFTVCWAPSLHREQGAMFNKGLRAALIAVGAKSAGRIRVTYRVP